MLLLGNRDWESLCLDCIYFDPMTFPGGLSTSFVHHLIADIVAFNRREETFLAFIAVVQLVL